MAGQDPESIDRYRVRRRLGAGAMGVVYVAHDPDLDRDVAIEMLPRGVDGARLRREAKALARLSHPNVVAVHDVGEHDGQVFVAMSLVDGVTLRQWLETPHTSSEILRIVCDAGRGIIAAHAAGLIHRARVRSPRAGQHPRCDHRAGSTTRSVRCDVDERAARRMPRAARRPDHARGTDVFATWKRVAMIPPPATCNSEDAARLSSATIEHHALMRELASAVNRDTKAIAEVVRKGETTTDVPARLEIALAQAVDALNQTRLLDADAALERARPLAEQLDVLSMRVRAF